MSENEPITTAAEDRVPWYQLAAYGTGGLIPIALFNIAGQLMGLLGNISLGLNALWLGIIMIIPRLWDAVSDPLIGHLSDNTRTRWGRRRPFIFIGGLAVAVSFVAMWWVPRGDWIHSILPTEVIYNRFQLAYILAGLVLFFTACTIFEIPHGALGMEMTGDPHERTRLFSAKSFLGNFAAMGTPWLLYLAGLEFFRGKSGDLADGMRYVSLFIATALIPMSYWWFISLREPGFQVTKEQEKTSFLSDMATAISNKTFLSLVVIIFTLAMGFNFVSLFNYYISIFYLYRGDAVAAGPLLGVNGTVWAITGLVAVFPLNWISRRQGKSKTLLIAILLMCAAQLSKIICYDPDLPYLVVIPTVLLSAGMLMFFTLGSSMVGDICDEDELHTGKRSEGTYYSVYWWFIKMGTAFASFVTGALLVYTQFDERQNVLAGDVTTQLSSVISSAEEAPTDSPELTRQLADLQASAEQYHAHVVDQASKIRQAENTSADFTEHYAFLEQTADQIASKATDLQAEVSEGNARSDTVLETMKSLEEETGKLRWQSAVSLFRLRAVEIGLPLLLSTVSIFLTLRYPLTEDRCYEIKHLLEQRRARIEP